MSVMKAQAFVAAGAVRIDSPYTATVQSGGRVHVVARVEGRWTCSCPHGVHQRGSDGCSHIQAVKLVRQSRPPVPPMACDDEALWARLEARG